MSILDFLKRKKTAEKAKEKKEGKSAFAKAPADKEEKSAEEKPVYAKKKTAGFSFEAVREPHISEKAADLGEKKNQYIFKVSENYNKKEIKKTIEGLYGVDVLSVNVIKIPKKKKRVGRIEGYKKGFSKAIIKIREGQKIEIL